MRCEDIGNCQNVACPLSMIIIDCRQNTMHNSTRAAHGSTDWVRAHKFLFAGYKHKSKFEEDMCNFDCKLFQVASPKIWRFANWPELFNSRFLAPRAQKSKGW